ncbi:type IV secretory system conjugative DNA transfer family protein [Streptomyces luteolus]|uniref:Type IV secretory system conjugative DNA transfer family protein n=1 Tax=Streptomyces luteolus TaxID=3043615 RepID=A0ABT6T7V1_9ACTN|nr:type IV secretory system conjugative DNA transfer family protein [Streptomyces sp. B-S-A12]MDI3423978.1 type IV secretory system conjugative DNA transfer family protein [Streptomyces sp. B-S-A12]
MRDPHPERREGGGIPDGLLVALLAFLLGLTLLVWTATGLSALLAKGAWPDRVTFARTPLAIRHLISQPHDIPGAWPDSPEQAFSGYGLFWGLFIGQLLVLTVLVVFVMSTVARWRATAVGRRSAGRNGWAQPHVPDAINDKSDPVDQAAPEPTAPSTTTVPTPRTPLILAPPAERHPSAVQAIQESEGPALVVTSDPTLWEETKDARAKLGPVLLYDPEHRCDTPARMHWPPTTGCEDKPTAAARARALLAPVRPTAKLDATTASTAETLLRSYLHAAAIDGRPFKHVHRWAQGSQVQEAVRVLRTSGKAASGSGGELEAALTAHPERRDMAQELTARALSALFSVHIREACAPNRTDTLTLDSFIAEGGTLYVVGEPIEDPKSAPGAMPLLTALVSSVVEHGRRMAARSSSGRLDPPLALILDDVAAVAPLPELPELLADGADSGLPTLALLRSREQARARWPHDDLPV